MAGNSGPRSSQDNASHDDEGAAYLGALQQLFERSGKTIEDGWSIKIKLRTGGNTAGSKDKYYISPVGRSFRSMKEVARAYDLEGGQPGAKSGAALLPRSRSAMAASPSNLPREEAAERAKKALAELELPKKLKGGGMVESLGEYDEATMTPDGLLPTGFQVRYEDREGVSLLCSVTGAPRCRVHGHLGDHRVLLGAGATPEAAWEVAEGTVRAWAAAPPPAGASPSSSGDARSRVRAALRDSELFKGASWGVQRFGFADVDVLRALEGLPGVAETEDYVFAEQREGWGVRSENIRRELHKRGLGALAGKRMFDPDAPRGAAHSGKRSEMDIIERVMERLITQVETRAAATAQREEKHAVRQREREEARRVRQETQALLRKQAGERLLLEREAAARADAAALVEARERARLLGPFPDETLSGAGSPLVPPPSLPGLSLGAAAPAALLELWQLLRRFPTLLGLGAKPPALDALEAAFAEPDFAAPGASQARELLTALVEFLLIDVYESAADGASAAPDFAEADFRPLPRSQHPVPVTFDTLPEAARRCLFVFAAAAQLWAAGGRAGASEPGALLAPGVLLQWLTAGPPRTLREGCADHLPLGASPLAGQGLVARAHARAVARSEGAVFGEGNEAGNSMLEASLEHGPVPIPPALVTPVLRCCVEAMATIKAEKGRHGRTLCFGGGDAACFTKTGTPMDLRQLSALVDAGAYAAFLDPLEALAADVEQLAALFQAAAAKQGDLGAALGARGAAEVSALAVSKLESLRAELAELGAEAFLEARAPHVKATEAGAMEVEGEGVQKATEGAMDEDVSDYPEPVEVDFVRDGARPYRPWPGCAMCWCEEDQPRLLLCDGCTAEYHTYCLPEPLLDVPEGRWLCPSCQGRGDAVTGLQRGRCLSALEACAPASGGPLEDPLVPPQLVALLRLASDRELGAWAPRQRLALCRLLARLAAASPMLRAHLLERSERVAEARRDKVAAEKALRELQREMAAAAAEKAGAGPGAAQAQALALAEARRATRSRGAGDEAEHLLRRIAAAEEAVAASPPDRLVPAGHDRHWHRYWVLPASALSPAWLAALEEGRMEGEGRGGDAAGAKPDAKPRQPPLQPPRSLLVVERCLAQPGVAGLAGARGLALDLDPGSSADAFDAPWEVGVFARGTDLERLQGWLDLRGVREGALRRVVGALLEDLRRAPEAKADEKEANEEDQPMVGGLATSVNLQTLAEPSVPVPPYEPSTLPPSEERLRQALLATLDSWPAASLHAVRGNQPRIETWRVFVLRASAPQELMAAALALEGMLLPAWLKPHWRPWARPCPDPAGTALLASVWLRLEALRSAVRSRVPLRLGQRAGIAGGNVLPASGRYAMRDRAKAAAYREDPDAGDASDSDNASHASQAPQLDRAGRALKRSKVRADHADGSEDESAYGGARQEEAWEGKRSRPDHSEPPTAQASPSVSSSTSPSEDNAQDESFAPSSSDEEFGGSPMDRDEV